MCVCVLDDGCEVYVLGRVSGCVRVWVGVGVGVEYVFEGHLECVGVLVSVCVCVCVCVYVCVLNSCGGVDRDKRNEGYITLLERRRRRKSLL